MTKSLGQPPRRLRPLDLNNREDVSAVLAWNAADVEKLAPLDEPRLGEIVGLAHRVAIIEIAGRPCGFVVTVGAGAAYDSANYAWFSARFGSGFSYLDRIVIAPQARRQGVASWVYDQIERDHLSQGRLALEVNIRPANEPSLAFHRARGYEQIGEYDHGDHTVGFMVKPLKGAPA